MPGLNSANKTFQYKAFISYRHGEPDRKWAKWVLTQLESYRVPKSLQRQGFPKYVGKLYRDEDEAPASSDLPTHIRKALEQSEFLIIICSKNTPESQWVSREIETFTKLGRANSILTLLVDGEPSEAFPPALSNEPAAADVRSNSDFSGKEREKIAILKLAAGLLGCNFDDLRRRNEERELKRKRLSYSAVFATLLIVAAAGFYYWDTTRLKTAYYSSLNTRWAIPYGVNLLSKEQFRKISHGYKFLTRNGRVIAIERKEKEINHPLEEGIYAYEFHHMWKYYYNNFNRLERIEALTKSGTVDYVYSISHIGEILFFDANTTDGKLKHLGGTDAPNIFSESKSKEASTKSDGTKITRIHLKFDKNGNTIRREYSDHFGNNQRNIDGAYGYDYQLDENGFIKRKVFLDKNGSIAREIYISSIYYKRSGQTNLIIEKRYTDPSGNVVLNENWCGIAEYIRDTDLNITDRRCYKDVGVPTYAENGFHSFRSEYDENGNEVTQSYFAPDDSPATHYKNGWHRSTAKFDNDGNISEIRFFDSAGKKTLHKSFGHHLWRAIYDPKSRERIEARYFGLDDEPILRKDKGFHLWHGGYNDGRRLMDSYFGTDEKPILDNDGHHQVSYVYDDFGRKIKETYRGVDRKPVFGRGEFAKHAIWQAKYDLSTGHHTESFFFGQSEDEMAERADWGHHKWTGVYDDNGNLTEERYFDANGEPILNSRSGYHLRVRRFDHRGLNLESRFYGVKGLKDPTLRTDYGHHIWRAKFDRRGKKIEETYYDKGGAPLQIREDRGGYHRIEYEYDERGFKIFKKIYDKKSVPMLNDVFGCHMWKYEYNLRGDRIRSECYGTNSERIIGPWGYHREDVQRNLLGKVTHGEWFDVSLRKSNPKLRGCATYIIKYDNSGTIEQYDCLLAIGDRERKSGIVRTVSEYTNGKISRQIDYDEDGNVVGRHEISFENSESTESAEAGDLYRKAIAILEMKNRSEEDTNKAIELLERSWELGNPWAAYNLANYYFFEGVKDDKYYEKSGYYLRSIFINHTEANGNISTYIAPLIGFLFDNEAYSNSDFEAAGRTLAIALSLECEVGNCSGLAHENTDTLSGYTIEWIQKALASQGLYSGRIDGRLGPKTKTGLKNYLTKICADEAPQACAYRTIRKIILEERAR